MNRIPDRLGPLSRTVILALVFLVLSQVAYAVDVGGLLPELRLNDVSTGEVVDIGGYLDGSVGAVVFMQTSCSSCRKELNALKAIAGKYPEFKVVVVSVDTGEPGRVNKYRKGYKFPFLFAHDPEYSKPGLFGFTFTPALVLKGRDGVISLLKRGFKKNDAKGLEETIVAMLD